MYFVVVVMALFAVGAYWFFFANGVQSIEESINPTITSDKVATTGNWDSWVLANTFVNNIWLFFLVFLVIGLAYYGYNEAQRRGRAQ